MGQSRRHERSDIGKLAVSPLSPSAEYRHGLTSPSNSLASISNCIGDIWSGRVCGIISEEGPGPLAVGTSVYHYTDVPGVNIPPNPVANIHFFFSNSASEDRDWD